MIVDITQVNDEYFHTHELRELLGQGGQGAVFKTHDPSLVIKLKLVKDEQSLKPVLDQARIHEFNAKVQRLGFLPVPDNLHLAMPVASLKKPAGYIMRLVGDMAPFEKFRCSGECYQQYEQEGIPAWLSGFPKEMEKFAFELMHYVKTGGLRRRLNALSQCASIIARLHASALVYGDISPGNTFVSSELDHLHVWLIDADNLRFEVPGRGNSVYTPGYGAPELVQGRESGSFRTDCHAFAVMAFFFLSLQHPFMGQLALENEGGGWEDEAGQEESGETLAYAGKFPFVDDLYDDGNRTEKQVLPRTLLFTDAMVSLFQQTFGAGRTDPWQRPSIFHWPSVLAKAADSTLECRGCGMSFYPGKHEDGVCPYCQTSFPLNIRLIAYTVREDGKLGEIAWEWLREIDPGQSVVIPKRVLLPFAVRDHQEAILTIHYDGQEFCIECADSSATSVKWASIHIDNGRFHTMVNKVVVSAEEVNDGLYLHTDEVESRLIKLHIQGAQL